LLDSSKTAKSEMKEFGKKMTIWRWRVQVHNKGE